MGWSVWLREVVGRTVHGKALSDVERPAPGPGSVHVRVVASGTHPADAMIHEDGWCAGNELPAVLGHAPPARSVHPLNPARPES